MDTRLRYLEPSEIRAWQPPGSAHLRLEIVNDRTILSAGIKRTFPLSEPTKLVSILDGSGKEVGILRTLDGLDSDTREVFQRQLDRRYFTPEITRIEGLRMDAGMWKFEVVTHRGSTEFFVRNWRDSAVEIAPGRWQIHSVDGGRFEITNLEALDAHSRKLMDQLL